MKTLTIILATAVLLTLIVAVAIAATQITSGNVHFYSSI